MVQTNKHNEYKEPAGGILHRLYQQSADDPLRSLLLLMASLPPARNAKDSILPKLPAGRGGCQVFFRKNLLRR